MANVQHDRCAVSILKLKLAVIQILSLSQLLSSMYYVRDRDNSGRTHLDSTEVIAKIFNEGTFLVLPAFHTYG